MFLIIRSRLTLPQHDPYLVLLTFTEPEIKYRSNYQTKILQEKQFKVRQIQLKLKNASTFRKKAYFKILSWERESCYEKFTVAYLDITLTLKISRRQTRLLAVELTWHCKNARSADFWPVITLASMTTGQPTKLSVTFEMRYQRPNCMLTHFMKECYSRLMSTNTTGLLGLLSLKPMPSLLLSSKLSQVWYILIILDFTFVFFDC